MWIVSEKRETSWKATRKLPEISISHWASTSMLETVKQLLENYENDYCDKALIKVDFLIVDFESPRPKVIEKRKRK
jgi:hypothetical protein